MSFTEGLDVPPGFKMSFKDALHVVSGGVIVKLAVPRCALGLTQRFREVDLAYNELEVKTRCACFRRSELLTHYGQRYMAQMIRSRENAGKEERYDLFSGLLAAVEGDSDGELRLTDAELVGKPTPFNWRMWHLYSDRQHIHISARWA